MDREVGSKATDIDDTALDWFTRLRGTASAADRAAFERWVAASPSHRQAFRRVQSLWSAAEAPGSRVAQEESEILSAYLDTMDRARTRRKARKRGAVAIVAGLAILSGAIALERPDLFQDMRADAVSARGERRTVDLPDGSTVLLDADSALAQRFTNGERRVALLRGGAYFSVVKAAQSFVVEASSGTVEVLGTKFDVRLSDDEAVVTVAQGRVAVTSPNMQRALLEPGQQVRFDNVGVGPVRSADLAASMAWHEGRFVFYQARFADVIGELQRYRPGRLIIASAALADSRVSGSFTLDDPDAALESLRSTVNFETYSILGRLTVLR